MNKFYCDSLAELLLPHDTPITFTRHTSYIIDKQFPPTYIPAMRRNSLFTRHHRPTLSHIPPHSDESHSAEIHSPREHTQQSICFMFVSITTTRKKTRQFISYFGKPPKRDPQLKIHDSLLPPRGSYTIAIFAEK